MKINLFIFDWSGVVSDDRLPVYEANMQVLREYGKPVITFDEWLPRTTLTPVEFFANHGVFGDHDELFALYKKHLDEANMAGIVPRVYPDVHDVFNHLKSKGKEIAVLSSHPGENLVKEADSYGVTEFISLILGNSRDKVEGLLEVCGALKENPECCLYIGDTIYDIQAAKGAGMHSGGVCQGYHVKERLESENPDLVLESLSDLKKLDLD
jgi:HAD superfamily hydrolase (TIGR01509 family)